jgi:hypothetical protein
VPAARRANSVAAAAVPPARAQFAALTRCASQNCKVQSFASALRVLMRNMLSVLSISFLLVNLLSWSTVRLAAVRRRERLRLARASCTF